MTTAIAFIFVLGILVFIHELGHFLIAKKVGIKVEKFSLGFPPNIFQFTRGETTYCVGIIPLGGFVKMAGENPDETVTGSPDEFMSKSVGQRAAVIFAGPFMNYILAIVVLIGIFMVGQPRFDQTQILVGQVESGPAKEAGLQENDVIVAIDGLPVTNFDSLRTRINKRYNEALDLSWVRGADTITKNITTKVRPISTADGKLDSVGVIGFAQKIVGYDSYGFAGSVQKGFVTAHIIVWETGKFLKQLVTGQVSTKMIGGPLFIARQSGEEARKGLPNLFFFMALLSVNLAVLNVLPIPVLDGGHLLFLAVEAIKGSPVSRKARAVAQQVGLVFLLALIVFVTYNDIVRVFKGF